MLIPLPSFGTLRCLFSFNEKETKGWIKRFYKMDHPKKVKAMRKLYSEHGIILSRPENIIKDMRERIFNVGIFSLSEDHSNELMWAHYGANSTLDDALKALFTRYLFFSKINI